MLCPSRRKFAMKRQSTTAAHLSTIALCYPGAEKPREQRLGSPGVAIRQRDLRANPRPVRIAAKKRFFPGDPCLRGRDTGNRAAYRVAKIAFHFAEDRSEAPHEGTCRAMETRAGRGVRRGWMIAYAVRALRFFD